MSDWRVPMSGHDCCFHPRCWWSQEGRVDYEQCCMCDRTPEQVRADEEPTPLPQVVEESR